ncbi:MAG: MATE family efflux transporter [Lachnospiraceae bacterium]|nr:MATE family efflux transporter [Lachnospiraceae bacterium]
MEQQTQKYLKQLIQLSIPAVLAQISSIIMQYIDAAMVGSLGAAATAAIGLVSSTTWLFGGLCVSAATGFSVQVAQLIGAENEREARDVLRQAILCTLLFGLTVSMVGIGISSRLPVWLGGAEEIRRNASRYFLIYACALPAAQMRHTAGSALQCSGDMKVPSRLNIMMCGLDVIFNSLLIFPTRQLSLPGISVTVPGAGMGVTGAALGTALAEAVTAVLMLYAVCFRSKRLRLFGRRQSCAAQVDVPCDETVKDPLQEAFRFRPKCLRTAICLALPMAFEHTIMCGAHIAETRIVAPLGTVSVAANSLAVTAESLCYMPGSGIGTAATTLVGLNIGAGRPEQARRYANLAVSLGAAVMTCTGGMMFLCAPLMFSLLTPDAAIRALGVKVLRIEAFAEPLFAVSIVTAGALRGAGDTLIPSLINLASMWGVRITAASLLAPRLGLVGVWIAMCGELCVRGLMFLVRLLRGKWLDKKIT